MIKLDKVETNGMTFEQRLSNLVLNHPRGDIQLLSEVLVDVIKRLEKLENE